MLGCIDEPAASAVEIFSNIDGDRRGLSRGKIVTPDVSRLFEHDRLFADRRELDVEISEMRELLGLFRAKVDNEQIHSVVAIRGKIDFVVRSPHRADIL